MAKNFIQPGNVVTVTAPAGGVSSGDGVLIGTLFGVAQTDAADGAEVEILTEGVVDLSKTTPLAIAAGDRLFWDAVNKVLNKTAAAQICVGVAVAAAADADATVRIKLGAMTPAGT
jgi:predicted RecA/RadA family phage recombinase